MKVEDYVSFEVASLLKKQGYNCYQKQHYFTENISVCDGMITIKSKTLTDMFYLSNEFDSKKIYAPSLWDAQKWLVEKYNLFVSVLYNSHDEGYYEYRIYKIDTDDIYHGEYDKNNYFSYKLALNEGIKEALKMI